MEKTYKRIIDELESFVSSHGQLQTFGFGPRSEISTEDTIFPLLWLEPMPGDLYKNLQTVNFNMFVIDILDQDKDNRKDVYSDTMLMGLDVVSRYWDSEMVYEMVVDETNVYYEPFEERFDDYTCGWRFSIDFQIENRLNSCDIP